VWCRPSIIKRNLVEVQALRAYPQNKSIPYLKNRGIDGVEIRKQGMPSARIEGLWFRGQNPFAHCCDENGFHNLLQSFVPLGFGANSNII